MTAAWRMLGLLKLCSLSLCGLAAPYLLRRAPAIATESSPAEQPIDSDFPSAMVHDMWWVAIHSPANPPDRTGCGTVQDPFLIGRYEVSNDEYCRFLNGSRTGCGNKHGVSDGSTRPDELLTPADWDKGILRTQAADGTFSYIPAPKMGDKPVVNLRWCDAARMANWLHNGADEEADTEHGAYQLADKELAEGEALIPLPGARVWIPSLDEWYKAAFHSNQFGVNDRYWKYPTCSHQRPRPVRADSFGIGRLSDKADGNSANFSTQSRWPAAPPLLTMMRRPQWTASGAVTSVGSNGRASSYGTYDMAGNAPEIVTVVGSNPPRVMASVVGGGITDTGISDCISADSAAIHHTGCGGFRLACAVSELIPIKEPRKHAPLERIEALLRNVLTCLDDVIEGPADQVTVNSLQSIRKRLHGVEVQAQANSAGTSLLAITREARELLDAIGEDVVKRDTCLDQVAATARVASALMDVEGVRILAEADKLEIYSQFKCEYLPHQEKAKNLRDAARKLLPENLPAAP